MKNTQTTLRYGFYSFLGIAFFFLLMKLAGLEEYAGLRSFNIIIALFFTNLLARKNVQLYPDINYLEALASLFLSNAFAVILSGIGFIMYVRLIDPQLLTHFNGGVLWAGRDISLFQFAAFLFLEGMAGSIVISFSIMQYWKDVKNVVKNKTH